MRTTGEVGGVKTVFYYTPYTGHTCSFFLLLSSPQSPPHEAEYPSSFSTYLHPPSLKDQFKLLPSKKYSLNTIIHSKNNKIPLVSIPHIIHFP